MPRVPSSASWWADPLAWVEIFALNNIAFLALDIGLAHAVNSFAHSAEWIPVGFSVVAPGILLVAAWLGGLRPPLADDRTPNRQLARWLGLAVGWGSVVVGIAGLLFHLHSAFFDDQTLKNLVYTAPFVAPLAYTGVGLLLILNRMQDARSVEWARWVVLLALGGSIGNFVLTLADHAQNGFFSRWEWVGVVSSAFVVSTSLGFLIAPRDRTTRALALLALAVQSLVGVLGFVLHLRANLASPMSNFWQRFLYGAPQFAPLLLDDLALLSLLGFWAFIRNLQPHVATDISH